MPLDTVPELESPNTLYRLAYISHWDLKLADGSPDIPALNDVLAKSRERNKAGSLTGILLHSQGALIQILEGPMETMEATFENICQDMRHRDLKLIDCVPVPKRKFNNWMASEFGDGHDPTRPDLQAQILQIFDQMAADSDNFDFMSQIAAISKDDNKTSLAAAPKDTSN